MDRARLALVLGAMVAGFLAGAALALVPAQGPLAGVVAGLAILQCGLLWGLAARGG